MQGNRMFGIQRSSGSVSWYNDENRIIKKMTKMFKQEEY